VVIDERIVVVSVTYHLGFPNSVNRPPSKVLCKVRLQGIGAPLHVPINQANEVNREFPSDVIHRDEAPAIRALFPVFSLRNPLDYRPRPVNVSGREFENQLFTGWLLSWPLLNRCKDFGEGMAFHLWLLDLLRFSAACRSYAECNGWVGQHWITAEAHTNRNSLNRRFRTARRARP
jgi:hypothetical protein